MGEPQHAPYQSTPDHEAARIIPRVRGFGVRRVIAWIGSVLFVIVLTLPVLQWRFDLVQMQHEVLREYREKAKAPPLSARHLSLRTIESLPTQIDAYLRDHFGFRDLLVQLDNTLRYRVLGISPIDKIIRGKDDWLYYTGNGAIEFYRGANLFRPAELVRIAEVYETRRRYLESLGIQYVVLLVPNKESIYPEYLPDYITKVSETTRYDQFVEYIRHHTKVRLVDLKPALTAVKNERLLYRKSDGHWNGLGAFVAYQELFRELKTLFPQLTRVERSEYELLQRDDVGEMGRMLGLYRSPSFPMWYLKPKTPDPWFNTRLENEGIGGRSVVDRRIERGGRSDLSSALAPSALVYRDSFFAAMTPFFSKHFARSIYLTTHKFSFDPVMIEQERPAVVIDQFIERYLQVPRGHELPLLRKRIAGESFRKLGREVGALISSGRGEPLVLLGGQNFDAAIPPEKYPLNKSRRYLVSLETRASAPARLRVMFGREGKGFREGDSFELSINPGSASLVVAIPQPARLRALRFKVDGESAVTVSYAGVIELHSVKSLSGVQVRD